MKPAPFEYAAPASIDEAVALLREHRDHNPYVLAGGQSLVPMMNFRKVKPGFVVDLRLVEELTRIREVEDGIIIGAMVRQAVAEKSPLIRRTAAMVVEALGYVAHPSVRNSGTIGGSLSNADPAAELPVVTTALGAVFEVQGPSGRRDIDAANFFLGPYKTALTPGEILVSVHVPSTRGAQGFVEFARTNGSFAVVSLGARIAIDDGLISEASIALSGVAPTALKVPESEQVLLGQPPKQAVIDAAADAAVTGLSPISNLHGSPPARVAIARSYVKRALGLAIERAQNGDHAS